MKPMHYSWSLDWNFLSGMGDSYRIAVVDVPPIKVHVQYSILLILWVKLTYKTKCTFRLIIRRFVSYWCVRMLITFSCYSLIFVIIIVVINIIVAVVTTIIAGRSATARRHRGWLLVNFPCCWFCFSYGGQRWRWSCGRYCCWCDCWWCWWWCWCCCRGCCRCCWYRCWCCSWCCFHRRIGHARRIIVAFIVGWLSFHGWWRGWR